MSDRHAISPYPIRMPAEMRDRLEADAKKGSRSLHAEVLARLEASFRLDEIVQTIAPGASAASAPDVMLDVWAQLEEALQELHDLRNEANAHDLKDHLDYSTGRLDKIESRIEYMIEQFQKLSKE